MPRWLIAPSPPVASSFNVPPEPYPGSDIGVKVSVSLPGEDVEFLDEYAKKHAATS
jgi:hypothetical protein